MQYWNLKSSVYLLCENVDLMKISFFQTWHNGNEKADERQNSKDIEQKLVEIDILSTEVCGKVVIK